MSYSEGDVFTCEDIFDLDGEFAAMFWVEACSDEVEGHNEDIVGEEFVVLYELAAGT
jgi:hypothetical protein